MSAAQQFLIGIKGAIAPTNTVAPAVTGTAAVGQTLSCSTGSWTGSPAPTYTYQWQHGTTNISGKTSSTYLVEAAYIGETLRCIVTATNSAGSASANSASTGAVFVAPGQVAYTSPGSYSWTCPAGVTSISVVCVGVPITGYGGSLVYLNNYPVTPGNAYAVSIGTQGVSDICSLALSTSLYAGSNGAGGGPSGYVKYSPGSHSNATGGAGAAGYAGNGGDGASGNGSGQNGSGGGGGGGGMSTSDAFASAWGGGGGVGLLGQGSSGTGGSGGYPVSSAGGGTGGSGGGDGGNSTPTSKGNPGLYGGGGGASNADTNPSGGQGAVRIIWPGTTRQFPSTNTTDM